MTEQEWVRCIDLDSMLYFLQNRVSTRKFQLFAVGCCRVHWDSFADEPCRQTVNVAERFADGKATEEELRAAIAACDRDTAEAGSWNASAPVRATRAAANCGLTSPSTYAEIAANATRGAVWTQMGGYVSEDEGEPHGPSPHEYRQIMLLYDVIGNPFRLMDLQRDWLTSDVVALASRAYQSRDFSLLPILADALQEAGCDNEDILSHCRGPGPHVRGCWVVDLVLGKV